MKKYKFWIIWTPLSLLWVVISLCIVSVYGDSTRGLALLLTSPLVIVGLYFASKRTTALESQNKIDSNRLLTETFSKSIELLGNEQEAVRQGAIHALGKIAETNSDELTVIVNTLCAFIRHKQSKSKLLNNQSKPLKFYPNLSIDIEAAIKTIVKLSNKFELEDTRHDLSNIILPYADFSRAKLVNFNLSDAHFYECIFDNVDFSNSNLIGSDFNRSNFKDAIFNKGTEIMKANFFWAQGLTQKIINEALGDKNTNLPKDITKPDSWESI